MNFFWVNLGKTHKEVEQYKFLWAPLFTVNKKGTKVVRRGWEIVKEVKKGDIIFCHQNGKIVYLARAKTNPYESPRPDNRKYKEWTYEGSRIDVDLIVLDIPILVDKFRLIFITHYNRYCDPFIFDITGNVAQKYMSKIPPDAASLISTFIDEDISIDFNNKSSSVISRIGKNKTILTKARIGQGKYRKDLLKLWKNKCAVTKVADKNLLVASHIVAWNISDPKEKIDPYNGLLLTPNLDKLFDLGFISFDDNGNMLFKKEIENSLERLSINKNSKLRCVFEQNIKYLKRHREIFKFN